MVTVAADANESALSVLTLDLHNDIRANFVPSTNNEREFIGRVVVDFDCQDCFRQAVFAFHVLGPSGWLLNRIGFTAAAKLELGTQCSKPQDRSLFNENTCLGVSGLSTGG